MRKRMKFLVWALPAAALALALANAKLGGGNDLHASPTGPSKVAHQTADRVYLRRSDLVGRPGEFLPAGTRSLLNIRHAMKHGDFVWNDDGIPQGAVTIAVDLESQILSVFRDGHEIGSAVILYGADGHDSPAGTHAILGKARDYVSKSYDAAMPNTLWLTHDGVAIHASDVRRGRATHGCIGVPSAFAELLFDEASVGDTVTIIA